jgi:spermidine/putrescine transport system substrate-binding protein
VVASDDTVREMIEAKLLAPLDAARIQNIKNIDIKYLHPQCDPKQKYTVPYLMGSTGMLINKKYIKNNSRSWQILWDNQYAGKLAMLDDPFDVVAAACKLSGYSINTTNPNELAQVKKILAAQKPLLHGYHDVMSIQKLMIEEKLWAAQTYSGEGLAAVKENKDLEYIIPREGAAIWTDFFVMPRDAQHKEAAYRLLNYLHRADIMASLASELWYATPNTAAAAMMNPEVLKSPAVYPPQEVMARCELMKKEADAARSVQSLWADLMAQK